MYHHYTMVMVRLLFLLAVLIPPCTPKPKTCRKKVVKQDINLEELRMKASLHKMTHPSLHQPYVKPRHPPSDIFPPLPDTIVAGSRALLRNYPWVALLRFADRNQQPMTGLCTGVIINQYYMLTAAHCIGDPYGSMAITVGFENKSEIGTADITYTITLYVHESVWIHPEYDDTANHDIAFVKYEFQFNWPQRPYYGVWADVNFDNHIPFRPGMPCFIVGFGKEGRYPNLQHSRYLKKAVVNIIERNHTTWSFNTWYEGGLCGGDSGGPLVCPVGGKMMVVGINVSGGDHACDGRFSPGTATRPSAHINWYVSVYVRELPLSRDYYP